TEATQEQGNATDIANQSTMPMMPPTPGLGI